MDAETRNSLEVTLEMAQTRAVTGGCPFITNAPTHGHDGHESL